ncbi:MAG TPA: flagellar basal body P-ring formation chaperone FlgA [Burkholderiales bacterium]|nr:flagellar basal body P-ring formation chaperone FlgA [Burkholderiales bacterium]
MVRSALLFGIALGLTLSASAPAESQDPDAIRGAVLSFVQAQTREAPGRVEVGRLDVDPHLRLQGCTELEAFLPTGAKLWGNSTVGVRCLRPEKWSIFVPVQVRVWADVVVTARALSRGQTLESTDVGLRQLDLTQLPPGVLTDPQRAVGRVLNTALSGGTPLRAGQLREVPVVLQGQLVRVVFAGEGFRVSTEARALSNAGVGEPVQVRTSSGKLLKGTVLEPGVVEVR